MYLDYWGFEAYPYEIVPDLKFIYTSDHYREAMARLLYAITRRKGAALLTGDVGCGKTTLSRALIQHLSQKEYHVGLITNPMLEPIEFIREILYQFGIDSASHSKHDLLNALGEMMMKDFGENRTTLPEARDCGCIQRNAREAGNPDPLRASRLRTGLVPVRCPAGFRRRAFHTGHEQTLHRVPASRVQTGSLLPRAAGLSGDG